MTKWHFRWWVLFLPVFCAVAMAGQLFEFTGTVRDPLGNPIQGAIVSVSSGQEAVTGAEGTFHLRIPEGDAALRISHPEFVTSEQALHVTGPILDLALTLEPLLRYPESIVVQAIRADSTAPVTKKDIDLEQIEQANYGQEMPFLLSLTPSVTSYADSGMGAGYSYFYLRGIQQTRINMTLDGVPLNDPEESAVYFANYGDFNSAVQSVQIQRGVGTSTVGSSSYGGSINFASVDPSETRDFMGEVGTGSFSTNRAAVVLDSGRFESGLALYARLSYQDTDGFKEHSGVNQRTIYYGGTRQGERSFLKFFGFSGREKTQLAFLATEQSILEQNLRYNGLQPEETDNFGQDLFQVQYTQLVGAASSLAAQVYYNGAQGYFLLWDDPAAKTNLLKYSINGHFIGSMVTYTTSFNSINLTAGVHGNYFTRDHFQHIEDVLQYTNNGRKNEANAFAKLAYDSGRLHLYADAQVRYAMFRYAGDLDLGSIDWTFFNPKLGFRFDTSDHVSLYASAGRTGREPTRSDLLLGEDNATVYHDFEAVKPEYVNDFEAGVSFRNDNFQLEADGYAMEFTNEIALTGELSDIGLPTRKNVPKSFRRGFEVDLGYQVIPEFRIIANANFSYNRIAEWTQFYDVYDEQGNYAGSESRTLRNVQPLLTPEVILNQGVEWKPAGNLLVGVNTRWVSASYLDNTNVEGFQTPSYFNLDANLHLDLNRWWKPGSPRLRVQVNNVLNNDRIWPSGYSYLYFVRGADGSQSETGVPYFYPLATRTALVALEFQL